MLCLRRTINVLPRKTRYDGRAGCASAGLPRSTCRDVAPGGCPGSPKFPASPSLYTFLHMWALGTSLEITGLFPNTFA